MAKALWQALVATLVMVVAIKWLTGMAFMPLLLIALVIMAMAVGLSLRLERARRHN